MDDRLPDWAYTEDELREHYIELLNGPKWHDKTDRVIGVYMVMLNNKWTGKCLVLPMYETEDISAVTSAVNMLWPKLTVEFASISQVYTKLYQDSIYNILSEYRYEPKQAVIGQDYIFEWKKWMKEIIK